MSIVEYAYTRLSSSNAAHSQKMSGGALPRLAVLAFAWAAFGSLTGGQLCVIASWVAAYRDGAGGAGVERAAKWHLLCHAVGVLLLAAGGAVVRGGGAGYVPCAGNVTMDLPCMLEGQTAAYLAPYVLHFVGGSYFVASWLLDGCHLGPWAFSMTRFAEQSPQEPQELRDHDAPATQVMHLLTVFLTPQEVRSGTCVSSVQQQMASVGKGCTVRADHPDVDNGCCGLVNRA